jgi:MEDS: MEthanogen/methylotroph, DcmR Sensory domain
MPVREEMMDRVRDEGLDPHEVIRRGLLTLIPAQDAYLKNATFTPEFMVAFMRLKIIRKQADNHPSYSIAARWIGSSPMRRAWNRCTNMKPL